MDDYRAFKITNHNNCIGVKFPKKANSILIQCPDYEPKYRFWKVHKNEQSEYMFEILIGDGPNLKESGFFMGVIGSCNRLKLISKNFDGDQQDKRWFRYDTSSKDNKPRLMHINTQRYVTIQNKKLELFPQQTTSQSSESSGFSESNEDLHLQLIPTWEIKPDEDSLQQAASP